MNLDVLNRMSEWHPRTRFSRDLVVLISKKSRIDNHRVRKQLHSASSSMKRLGVFCKEKQATFVISNLNTPAQVLTNVLNNETKSKESDEITQVLRLHPILHVADDSGVVSSLELIAVKGRKKREVSSTALGLREVTRFRDKAALVVVGLVKHQPLTL